MMVCFSFFTHETLLSKGFQIPATTNSQDYLREGRLYFRSGFKSCLQYSIAICYCHLCQVDAFQVICGVRHISFNFNFNYRLYHKCLKWKSLTSLSSSSKLMTASQNRSIQTPFFHIRQWLQVLYQCMLVTQYAERRLYSSHEFSLIIQQVNIFFHIMLSLTALTHSHLSRSLLIINHINHACTNCSQSDQVSNDLMGKSYHDHSVDR